MTKTSHINNRILSLDVMRGIIMILLAAESCELYENLETISEGTFLHGLVLQFFHHPWHGLRAWDLVQPAFMTMAGTALYISFTRNKAKGISWQQNFPHIAFRCLRLLLCGVLLHCIYRGKIVWELWNVLSQLAVTTIIAYLIIEKSTVFQLIVSLLLLLATELLYRCILVPGFDQPFTEHHNFGAYMDTVLMGKINSDGWVAINFIPTAAHTIWGCLIGRELLNTTSSNVKIKRFILAGIIGLVLGFGLDMLSITPIIKRIATSSFTLASGGWVLLIAAAVYWCGDVRKYNRFAWIPVVVGMNSIFIYMLFETVGHQWLNHTVDIFIPIPVLSSLVVLTAYWLLCYWLYKRKIFFRL